MRHLRVKEAALLLRCSEGTIYRRIKAGQLTASKVGKFVLVDRSDVDRQLGQSRPSLDDVIDALVDEAPALTSRQLLRLREILGQ